MSDQLINIVKNQFLGSKKSCLVIGDLMLDQYIFGDVGRISPEAPVPVLNPEKTYSTPGGAGNVAINLAELGASVECIGTVGSDRHGKELISLLKQKNINVNHLYKIDLPIDSRAFTPLSSRLLFLFVSAIIVI